MDVKYQVFVSSTFVDLEVERRQVIETILNMGHIPVGMEAFHASDDSQWDYIKRRISECDYYVVIVGERYGSEYQGKSYTQMEYEFAVDAGLPVAAFLMSQAARDALSQNKVEFAKADQIKAFRELCQQKLCKHWDNGSDLALKVMATLVELTRERPMRGWVRPSKVPAEDVLQEMAMLLEQNRELQAIVDRIQDGSKLSIPPDALIRIEELSQVRLKDIMFRLENYDANYSLLDFFLRSKRELAKGADHLDLWEILREEFEAFGDDDEVIEAIIADLAMRKLVLTSNPSARSAPRYHLSEYGKDFILYAERWQQDTLTPTARLFS